MSVIASFPMENLEKGKSRNGRYKKTKHVKFSKKRSLVCIRGYEMFVFGKFGVLCFLVTPALRFVLLPYYQ